MSNTIFNPTQFPVFLEDIGKQLAPFESIVVDDAEAVARAVATGVLKDNIDTLDTEIAAHAEDLAHVLDIDVTEAEATLRAAMTQRIATWHDEHDAPVEHVAKADETVEAQPLREHANAENPDPIVEVPEATDAAVEVPIAPAQRVENAKGTETNQAPGVETRLK